MTQNKIYTFTLLIATFIFFHSCSEDNSQPVINGGSCLFVNHNTTDSIFVSGGINVGDLKKIYVHNGDVIEITFIPDRSFQNHSFDVTYTLLDGTRHTCTNHNYTYKFTVSNREANSEKILFNAKSTGEDINITANGAINVIFLDKEHPVEKPSKATVELTYCFNCDSDLVRFVTPEIIYTDKIGEHNTLLNESKWSPITYAHCYYTVEGTTYYETFKLEEGSTIPEPWIMEYTYSSFNWKQEVTLDKVGVTNNFIVRYHRKSNYVIEKDREYRLSRKPYCNQGSSLIDINGKQNLTLYSPISIELGGKTKWRGDEVQDYITELCAHNDTVSIHIDEHGGFTPLSKK